MTMLGGKPSSESPAPSSVPAPDTTADKADDLPF
jgi:hypothetical protein